MPQQRASYTIVPDDLSRAPVIDLLRFHLAEMHRWSPACKVHAMGVERLRKPDISFYTGWVDEELAAVGALKALDSTRGEIKSMRVAPPWLGKGAGEAMLLHLIAEARKSGYRWLGLETGRPEAFAPASNLYRKHGFRECPAFGDYVTDEFSLCMSRDL